jgi:hypothetical protein
MKIYRNEDSNQVIFEGVEVQAIPCNVYQAEIVDTSFIRISDKTSPDSLRIVNKVLFSEVLNEAGTQAGADVDETLAYLTRQLNSTLSTSVYNAGRLEGLYLSVENDGDNIKVSSGKALVLVNDNLKEVVLENDYTFSLSDFTPNGSDKIFSVAMDGENSIAVTEIPNALNGAAIPADIRTESFLGIAFYNDFTNKFSFVQTLAPTAKNVGSTLYDLVKALNPKVLPSDRPIISKSVNSDMRLGISGGRVFAFGSNLIQGADTNPNIFEHPANTDVQYLQIAEPNGTGEWQINQLGQMVTFAGDNIWTKYDNKSGTLQDTPADSWVIMPVTINCGQVQDGTVLALPTVYASQVVIPNDIFTMGLEVEAVNALQSYVFPNLTLETSAIIGAIAIKADATNLADSNKVYFFSGDASHLKGEGLTRVFSAIKNVPIYDIYVKEGADNTIASGSIAAPFDNLQDAVDIVSDKGSIFIDGTINITQEVVLPQKSISFYGSSDSTIQYASYDSANGHIIYHDGDNTATFDFNDIDFRNAGGYGLLIMKTEEINIRNCEFYNNGWNGTALNTALPSTLSGVLGYDSASVDLQAFYAGPNASNGGAVRIQECRKPMIRESRAEANLRGFRIQDCGINGGGFIIENQAVGNIESGFYIAAGGTYYGCQNMTVAVNFSAYNANNGLLIIGGLNNKFSQNEVNGNWNAGFCAWGAANTTLRDCGLYDNNRSIYNGIGNTGDAKASIQINEAYNLLGTSITLNPAARFIAEILDTQVHYTGLGSNTEKIGFLITSGVGALADNPKNIIKVDDVGFIGQDYAIDLSEVDVSNLRLSLGDNSYQSIGLKAVKAPLAGNYSELPFSNHVMEVPEVDVVVDTLKQTIALHEGVGGNVINVYSMNELQSILKSNSVDIIQKSSDKIQLRDCTLGNTYINGVVAGSNINTMNDSLNAAFSMDLTEYKEFIETEVGVVGSGDSATFYYIESPDGTYHYPLFKTEAEANLVDTELGGAGESHTHTYDDDLTNTTWYMPNVSNHMDSSVMPVNGVYTAPNGGEIESVVWNIQVTDTDANYLPTFTSITYDVQEGSAINIPYKPAGDTASYNITNIPSGYANDGFNIVGTAEDITNGYGQAVQHVLNVTKANSFGSVQGTITINVKADLAGNEFTLVDQNGVIKFTQDGGNSVLDFNTVTFNAGSTYKFFLDGSTIQTNDVVDLVNADGSTITGNDGLTQSGGSGPGYAGSYFQYVIPSDVAPGKFITFTDGATSTAYANVPLTIAGSTYTTSVTGVTAEGPTANFTGTVINANSDGWLSSDDTTAAGQRIVFDSAFITDLHASMPDYSMVFIGLKDNNWTNTTDHLGGLKGDAGIRFMKIQGDVGATGLFVIAYANGTNTSQFYADDLTNVQAFIEVTSDGNNIRLGVINSSSYNATTDLYANWDSGQRVETGDQGYGITTIDPMIYWSAANTGGGVNTVGWNYSNVDWTGLAEISIPVPSTSSTSFTKAVDFGNSSSAYLRMHSSDSRWPRIKLPAATVSAHSSDASKTSDASNAEPFLTACVFQPGTTGPSDNYGDQSGGRIWTAGQGGSIAHHNIMLEQKGNDIFFSWGQVMAQWPNRTQENQIRVIENADPTKWYGVYIAHRGHRSSSPSAADLGAMFDIYVMSSDDSFAALGSNISTASEWGESWNETGHSITGNLSYATSFRLGAIGGSSSIYSFSGKVASFVTHPLHINSDMPDAAEAKKVIVDPMGWSADMVGTSQVNYVGGGYTYTGNDYSSSLSTQIYLFGDGTNDSFTNSIRNQAYPLDTAYTKMNFNNMQASDIVNVTIPGL